MTFSLFFGVRSQKSLLQVSMYIENPIFLKVRTLSYLSEAVSWTLHQNIREDHFSRFCPVARFQITK